MTKPDTSPAALRDMASLCRQPFGGAAFLRPAATLLEALAAEKESATPSPSEREAALLMRAALADEHGPPHEWYCSACDASRAWDRATSAAEAAPADSQPFSPTTKYRNVDPSMTIDELRAENEHLRQRDIENMAALLAYEKKHDDRALLATMAATIDSSGIDWEPSTVVSRAMGILAEVDERLAKRKTEGT